MSKFNVTVEIDYIDEEGNLDEAICKQIVDAVVSKVSGSVSESIVEKANQLCEEKLKTMEGAVADRLNEMMEEFFNTPKDVTDRWGDIVKKGVTIKSLLKEACDNFMSQPLDKNGKPTSSSYAEYKTRVDYIVAKSVDSNMELAIKRATSEVTDGLKKKISDEIKKQMGDKLAGIVGLDDLLSK